MAKLPLKHQAALELLFQDSELAMVMFCLLIIALAVDPLLHIVLNKLPEFVHSSYGAADIGSGYFLWIWQVPGNVGQKLHVIRRATTPRTKHLLFFDGAQTLPNLEYDLIIIDSHCFQKLLDLELS